MTDNDIIKALEIHADNEADCSGCPIYHSDTGETCVYELSQNALDLINRQKEEIERLQKKGEWEYIDDIMITVCSKCGNRPIVNEFGNEVLNDYCPHCGAKMKGEV